MDDRESRSERGEGRPHAFLSSNFDHAVIMREVEHLDAFQEKLEVRLSKTIEWNYAPLPAHEVSFTHAAAHFWIVDEERLFVSIVRHSHKILLVFENGQSTPFDNLWDVFSFLEVTPNGSRRRDKQASDNFDDMTNVVDIFNERRRLRKDTGA